MVVKRVWGQYENTDVFLFTIINKNGHKITLTNYGASVVEVWVPDRKGRVANVVLGFPTLEGYLTDKCFIGNTIGRFANRIANGSFIIDGRRYLLELNENNHSNHSGESGFNRRLFNFKLQKSAVVFSLESKDGDGGFPGNLNVSITYSWNDRDELVIVYNAVSDRKTILNLTNHCYFNLSGGRQDILKHMLKIEADKIVEVDEQYISTGKLVNAGEKEFCRLQPISSKLTAAGGRRQGLNDCYVVKTRNGQLPVCEAWDQHSGRVLKVFSSYPGLLVYTGDYLKTVTNGHLGKPYIPFDGFCLECQFYPDSPNHSNFPSVILEPDMEYNNFIKYSFGVK